MYKIESESNVEHISVLYSNSLPIEKIDDDDTKIAKIY